MYRPVWHTDVDVHARCDVGFLVCWRFSGARCVGTELAPGTHLDGPGVYWPVSLGERSAFLPLTLYDTFVIEARFGFNKTTLTTFLTDLLKSLSLAVVLGGPLLAGVMAFLAYAGPYAWVYCWLALTVFTLGLQWLAPTWIMPLFNTFTPLEPGALKDAILAYAHTVNFAVADVFVIDGSAFWQVECLFYWLWQVQTYRAL